MNGVRKARVLTIFRAQGTHRNSGNTGNIPGNLRKTYRKIEEVPESGDRNPATKSAWREEHNWSTTITFVSRAFWLERGEERERKGRERIARNE